MDQSYLTDEYRENHKLRVLERSYAKHPYGYRIERKLEDNKRRAAERGKEWAISDEEARKCFVSDCQYCGRKSQWDLRVMPIGSKIRPNGIDRVNNDLGYIPGNCVPCCYECNHSKNDRSLEDFRTWVKIVYERFDLSSNC